MRHAASSVRKRKKKKKNWRGERAIPKVRHFAHKIAIVELNKNVANSQVAVEN
jgi:hypothetical protein